MDIDTILREMPKRKSSDLHLKVDRPPLMRISGELLPTEFSSLSKEDMLGMFKQMMDEKQFARFMDDRELDLSYGIEGVARFRVNAFMQRGLPGAAIRIIPIEIPSIDKLGLPPVLKDLVAKKQGLILVTGPTGSGKSTTLASMINEININRTAHIMTIEDPIEFVYEDQKATINQRELGIDTSTLKEALRRALRQDPDAILMGEMRDAETIEIAIHAAETGHIVFSTLHTNDAKQSIDRIIDSFPPESEKQIRKMLSLTLQGVICQRLLKRADGNGMVAALEIMINTPNISELIIEGKTADIEKAITRASEYYGMQTFNMALADLVRNNVVEEETAFASSASPDDLKLMLRGVSKSGASESTVMQKENIETAEADSDSGAGQDSPEQTPAEEASGAEQEGGEKKIKITRGFEF
mgnify:CR=1 FL=1